MEAAQIECFFIYWRTTEMPNYLKAKSDLLGISVVAPVSTNNILVAQICKNDQFLPLNQY